MKRCSPVPARGVDGVRPRSSSDTSAVVTIAVTTEMQKAGIASIATLPREHTAWSYSLVSYAHRL
jgi:hypothetical protein